MSDLGERIYTIRKSHLNMTQNQLIMAVNSRFGMKLSRNMLSNWERGKQKPALDALLALSEILGVTLDYLIKGKKEELSGKKLIPVVDNSIEIKNAEDIFKYGDYREILNDNGYDFYYKMPINNMINVNIYSGDYILFHIQDKLTDGDIGLFIIRGEVCVKRYYNQNNKAVLVDECIGLPPIIITKPEDFKILAKAVSVIRNLE